MRHRVNGRKLNRTASHRKALLRNLANQLIEHKEIKTTTAKAKEARSTIERLITYAKKGDSHHRRLAFGILRNKQAIKMLFDEIGPAFADRPGGYTRVLKLGKRQGDAADLSLLQLVGFEKLSDVSAKTDKKKKSRKKEPAPAAGKEKETAKEQQVTGQVTEEQEKAADDVPEEAAKIAETAPPVTEKKSEPTPDTKAESSEPEEKQESEKDAGDTKPEEEKKS